MTPSHPPDHEQIRAAVTARYSGLARAARAGQHVTDCDPGPFAAGCFGAAGYAGTSELPDGALRASLGCGNPVAVVGLHPGEIVLDLGSGGGIDVLLSARRVAPGGKAYGLDGSQDMITLARENTAQAGLANAEYLHGHIEDIPLPNGHVDVVVSNCVINLSADKPRVLAEAFRVLRPGGRLGIGDVIAGDGLDPARRAEAEQRTGCTTGTLTAAEYRGLLLASGFISIRIIATQDAEPGLGAAIIQATRPTAPPGILIRPMWAGDASQVLAIYQSGLDTGDASFEAAAPAWDAFDQAKLPLHRHVAVAVTGEVLGWAARAPCHRGRCTAASSSTPSTFARTRRARGSGPRCSMLSSAPQNRPGSGPSRPGSSPRTRPACGSTSGPGSASSAPASASAATTVTGVTLSSLNAAAPSPGPDPAPALIFATDLPAAGGGAAAEGDFRCSAAGHEPA
jgi:SAM-dependent methyltransferase